MDRVHTQLYNNQRAGEESGEQFGVIWPGDPVYLQGQGKLYSQASTEKDISKQKSASAFEVQEIQNLSI